MFVAAKLLAGRNTIYSVSAGRVQDDTSFYQSVA
jgi:hypothetical protein